MLDHAFPEVGDAGDGIEVEGWKEPGSGVVGFDIVFQTAGCPEDEFEPPAGDVGSEINHSWNDVRWRTSSCAAPVKHPTPPTSPHLAQGCR